MRRVCGRFGRGVRVLGALAVLTPGVVVSAAEPPPLERGRTIALKGPAGGLDHLAVDVKRGRLFVANTVNGSLDIVDPKEGRLYLAVPRRAERPEQEGPEVWVYQARP